jgi:hypothetical protein
MKTMSGVVGLGLLALVAAAAACSTQVDVEHAAGGTGGPGTTGPGAPGAGTGGPSTGSGVEEPSDANFGAPCIPRSESNPEFGGYSPGTVEWDRKTLMCGGDACIVDHFQGRASCPYGQTESEIKSLASSDPARCRATFLTGGISADPVVVPVAPQKVGRRAEDAIYCSCECNGPPVVGQAYCACPTGFACTALDALAQSDWFCIKQSPAYDPAIASGAECAKSGGDPSTDCGNNQKNP